MPKLDNCEFIQIAFDKAGILDNCQVDLVITLGGDGTILRAAWLFQSSSPPPILTFALGSLGFLTIFPFDDADQVITSVLKNGARVNLRSRLLVDVIPSKGSQNPPSSNETGSFSYNVINEVSISLSNSIFKGGN